VTKGFGTAAFAVRSHQVGCRNEGPAPGFRLPVLQRSFGYPNWPRSPV